jgi:hypothetical protein
MAVDRVIGGWRSFFKSRQNGGAACCGREHSSLRFGGTASQICGDYPYAGRLAGEGPFLRPVKTGAKPDETV